MTACASQVDMHMPSPHTTGRRYLGIGWMLASGKYIDLIHHLRYVRAKGAEHQSKVPLLQTTDHPPLSRRSHGHITGQSQQGQDIDAHTCVLPLCAPHSWTLEPPHYLKMRLAKEKLMLCCLNVQAYSASLPSPASEGG